jgi:hypothetical protein
VITVLSGLIGVIVGSLLTNILTGRSQRKQWLADNRKQEYRELLSTLTHSMTVIMTYTGTMVAIGPHEQKEFQKAYNEALRVLHDRIFVAEQIKRDKIEDRWTTAMAELKRTNDIHCLDDPFDEIKALIVRAATESYP